MEGVSRDGAREVKVDESTTTKMENLDRVREEEGNVSNKALMNPMIMHKIFGSLDTETLKSVRLVCTAWDDVGATMLGKQGALKFSTFPEINPHPVLLAARETFHIPKPGEELALFNPKLARNVTLEMMCNCAENCTCCPTEVTLPANFATHLPQICGKLESLMFYVGRNFTPCLDEMWITYDFPNLNKITIIVREPDLDNPELSPPPEILRYRPLGNLKVLILTLLPSKTHCFSGSGLSPLVQGLLNAAPNVEEVYLKTTFYPDFTPCEKLKRLRFYYQQYRDYFTKEVVQIDAPAVTRMIGSCPSLEKLTLDYCPYRLSAVEPIQVNLHLANLTHLRVQAVDLYIIEDSVNLTNLPQLCSYSIAFSRFGQGDISEMMGRYGQVHGGITKLHVACSQDANVDGGAAARKLVNLFPAVKEFKLELVVKVGQGQDHVAANDQPPANDPENDQNPGNNQPPENDQNPENDPENDHHPDYQGLTAMLQALGDWELIYGKVEIHHPPDRFNPLTQMLHVWDGFDSNGVIAVLQGLSGWRGLTNTSLEFHTELDFQLTDRMRAALLSCRTMESLDMGQFRVVETTAYALFALIEEHDLPILTNDESEDDDSDDDGSDDEDSDDEESEEDEDDFDEGDD